MLDAAGVPYEAVAAQGSTKLGEESIAGGTGAETCSMLAEFEGAQGLGEMANAGARPDPGMRSNTNAAEHLPDAPTWQGQAGRQRRRAHGCPDHIAEGSRQRTVRDRAPAPADEAGCASRTEALHILGMPIRCVRGVLDDRLDQAAEVLGDLIAHRR